MNAKRVVMLVNNDWRIDSRVMREAETLSESGYEVDVIARYAVTSTTVELRNGVRFHSLPYGRNGAGRFRAMLGRLAAHLQIVLLGLRNGGYPVGQLVRDCVWVPAVLLTGCLALPLLLPAAILWLAFRPRVRSIVVILLPRTVTDPLRSLVRRLLSTQAGVIAKVRRVLGERLEFLDYLDGMALFGVPMGTAMRPAVVHSHDLVTLAAGALIANRVGARLIYDSHELELHTNYWSLSRTTKRWMAIYEATLIRRADGVVTVCDSIAEWLKKEYRIALPCVVMNAPNLRSSHFAATGGVRTKVGISAATPLAVYVGSVTIDRGLVQCVRAAALCPELHLAFVGPRAPETEREILCAAKELNIQGRVHLIEPVPSEQVCEFIASADCSVLAIQNVCLSYYYCFPNKLLESVMARLPVAVARLIELERFVARFHVGVVMDETSPASIAKAIQELVSKPALYRPSAETLEHIRSEFGWETQQGRLRGLYAALS